MAVQALHPLVPAKAGTQCLGQELDTRFRGHEWSVWLLAVLQ
jgi:hypothetical protein